MAEELHGGAVYQLHLVQVYYRLRATLDLYLQESQVS
jgi:hypothetical protein